MAGQRPIDEKIVVMKLDNSDFAKKASETTSIFGKLRQALAKIPGVSLNKTVTELGNIKSTADKTNLNRLADSVQAVTSKFSNLGIVGITVLTNLTNRAVNAGISITKSLTLDQVTAGFSEYETKMKAIGTMLSNTEWAGSTLDDVKNTLNELNDYADKTVYNFGQMTENIGRFTAAGVTLEDSAIAIKGLGNLAAVSGSDVNQLNTAMYQMSQALASGKLNLEDWNSLVNAGMAGKKTQDALVATAKAMGMNVDMSEGFRNSIQDGWLTSEVLLETLKKFGNDDSMTQAATAVRTFSGAMDSLKEGIGSGWATTFEHIFGDFEEATVFWTDLSQSIGGWFAKSADARNKLIGEVADGGGFLNIFAGVQNAIKPIVQLFSAMGDGFRKAFPPKTSAEILAMASRFKEFTAGLKIGKETMGQLTTIFQGGFSVISTVLEIVKRLGSAFLKLIPDNLGGGVLKLLEGIAEMAIAFNKSVKEGNALTSVIDALGKVLGAMGQGIGATISLLGAFGSALRNNLGKAVDWIKAKLAPVGKYLKEMFGGDIGGDELAGAGVIAALVFFGTKISGFFDDFGDIAENIGETFEGLKDSIQNFALGIKIANLLLIAIALGILAASLKTLEGIKIEDLTKGISALAVALGVMIAGMVIIGKFNVTGGIGASLTLIALATAVSIMASALKKVSDIDPEEMKQGITGLIVVTGALAAAVIAISKLGGKIGAGSLQLIALATAVYILAGAVDKMSSIKSTSLLKSVGAMTLIFGALAVFIKVVDGSKFGPSSAIGILAIATSVVIIAKAIEMIADLDVKSLGKGLATIALVLAEVALFSKIAGGPGILAAGAGLLIIAGAINALIPPIMLFGSMSLTELAKGLGTMALALVAVVGAAMLASGTIGGAIAITAMAIALNLLVIPIKSLAQLSWGELTLSLVGLGAGLAMIGLAGVLLTPAVPAILGLGAAVALMGIALLAAGAGVGLFAAGLATLVTITVTSVASIVAALGLLLQGLATLIPACVDFIVKLGLALIVGIGKLVPPLVTTIADLIIKILTTLVKFVPDFIRVGTDLIVKLAEGLGKALPELLDAAVKLMIALIEGLADAIRDNGPELISAVLELVGEIILLIVEAGVQVIDALFGWIPGVKTATAKIGEVAEDVIRENFGAKQVAEAKGKEFADGLGAKSKDAKTAGEKVAKAGQDGANTADLKKVATTKGQDFAKGITDKASAATTAGKSLAEGGKTGAASVSMTTTGSNFGSGFASGISGAYNKVVSAAKSLAVAAKNKVESWLDINSPSRVMREDGGWFGEGFALGIQDKVRSVSNSAKNLAMTAQDSVNQFLQSFELPDVDNEIHFKAVVDYDAIDPSKFGQVAPLRIQPNTNLTNGLVSSSRVNLGQNGDNVPSQSIDKSTSNEYNYELHVNANGTMSKSAVRKLAEEIQTELKNLNDRAKISRGEEVVF